MSTTSTTVVTETQRSEPASLRELLRAYDIHQSGRDDQTDTSPSNVESHAPVQLLSTIDIEINNQHSQAITERRAAPPYRPVHPSASWSNRPASYSGVEGAFVVFMFLGVYVNGVG
jgi:hypothetical protein